MEYSLAFFTFVSFLRMRHKDAFVSRALPKLNTTEIDISSKKNADLRRRRRRRRTMGGKKISGARKRKKKKEKEEAAKEAAADMERLKLGPTNIYGPIWTGLVVHHKDVFVSHVLPKLNETDRFFFKKVNRESRGVLAYAGVDVSKLLPAPHECTSISTLEWVWNSMPKDRDKRLSVKDQTFFCKNVATTNKLEFLKWAREVKHCEWDEETITGAAFKGNLEMLKYCFSNGCPCDEEESCGLAADGGHLDCLRFLFDKVKPSRRTEKNAALLAASDGHMHILRYLVEERKISDVAKFACVGQAAWHGQLDCLKYLLEEGSKRRERLFTTGKTSLRLVTTNTPIAKTTCSKKGAQNQRTKNTLCLSSRRTGYEKR